MTPAVRELVKRLEAAEWFSAVGRAFMVDQATDVVALTSWREAISCLISIEWGEYTHQQRHCLSMHLFKHANAAFQHWQSHIRESKAALNPLLDGKLEALASATPSYDELSLARANVRFCLVGACLELIYADAQPP